MTWTGRQLPGDWGTRRLTVFERDNWTCVDCGYRNTATIGLECDHIGAPDDHRIEVLATRCGRGTQNNCHGKRTRQQSAAGRAAVPRARRPTEPHPGLR